MVRKNTLWDMIPKDWDVVVLGKYSELFDLELSWNKLDKNW